MKKICIVMYHYVRDLRNSRYPSVRGLDYQQFKQQIAFFEQNYHVVSMEEVIEAACGGGYLPQNAMLLTFDDGYIDHYEYVFPVLKAHKMQGSFFVPGKVLAGDGLLDVNKVHFILASAQEADLLNELYLQMDHYRGIEFQYPSNAELFQEYGKANRFDTKETIFIKRMLQTALPERLRSMIASELFRKFVGVEENVFCNELYMNKDQICMMKRDGMHFGLHGYSHSWLGNMDVPDMKKDILKALDILDGLIHKDGWTINYPYGNYNHEVLRFAASQGAGIGLTTKVAVVDLPTDSQLELPRLDCNDFPPISSNYKKYGWK